MTSEPKAKLPLHAIASKAFTTVRELPASKYRGIGKIVSAHALLEGQVFDLLCELANVEHAVGRVTFRYQAASERFKLVRKLLVLHGIHTKTNLKSLFKEIEECCHLRDTFAHGMWVNFISDGKYKTDDYKIADVGLIVTKGEFESDAGTVDRTFRPQISSYSHRFFDENRRLILMVTDKVGDLKEEIMPALQALRAAAV